MTNPALGTAFAKLSTPLIADACLKLKRPLLAAPPSVRPLDAHPPLAGRVLPARHYGSVDVFLEAIRAGLPGDVLVIDNEGRDDEACIGDLTALEARAHQLAGIVVWGRHRDTTELLEIGFPVFSNGACPAGPRRLDPREPDALRSARFGDSTVGNGHAVFADADGVLFTPIDRIDELISTAEAIQRTERRQAAAVLAGETLTDQLAFEGFLRRRDQEPDYTFRAHLRGIGGALEE